MTKTLATTIALTAMLAMGSAAWAQGNQTGFGSTGPSTTQGNSGKTNDTANPDNSGQVTTETTGPKDQIDKGATDCNNCETTSTGPGNSNR
jgi:hypothetical protein